MRRSWSLALLRFVSRLFEMCRPVSKEAREHALKSKNCHQRQAANMKAEKELCRERWPGLNASCGVHRVSIVQPRSLDRVQDRA